MILKSFSRTSRNMGDIISYITHEPKAGPDPLRISHNVLSQDTQALMQAFEDNLHTQNSRTSITAYHTVMSWHPKDAPHVTREAVYELARHYIRLRAPRALWFGQLHTDQAHPHMHLLCSGNEIASSKATSIRRPRFYSIRTQLEHYQKERFPALVHSLQYGHFRDYPQRFLRHRLLPVYEHAQTKDAFYTLAQSVLMGRATIDPATAAALYQGTQYPLADLGIDLDLFDRLARLTQIREHAHERSQYRDRSRF